MSFLKSYSRLFATQNIFETAKYFQPKSLFHTSTYVLRKDMSLKDHLDTVGESSNRKKEASYLGYVNYMKKHRQYAQFSFKDWKLPKAKDEISISCTRELIFPTVDDSDENTSSLKDRYQKKLQKGIQKLQSTRAIKKKVKDFHPKRFPEEAQQIYVQVHDLLNTPNWTIPNKEETEDKLHDLVTEFAYGEMINGLEQKTVQWKFIESIEAPKVVRIAYASQLTDDNTYAQVTVRFHSKQVLAVYDRFGRLMHGSPTSERNVLEYVCFERHLADTFGKWRIHAKLPTTTYPKEPIRKTVSTIQTSAIRSEAESWQEEELKTHPEKYYPEREFLMEKEENEKWKIVNLTKQRKDFVLNKRGRLRRMRGKAERMTQRKQRNIVRMRKEGVLPYPPKDFTEFD